jgi:hypothetical protein
MMKSVVYANYSPQKEVRESPCLIFTKWLQCDKCKHWVHLIYSTEKRVWSGKVMDFYAPTARVISTEIMISLIFKEMINLYFQGSQNVPATDDFAVYFHIFAGWEFIEHGFSNNFYVYVNCRYHVLLIYIFLSITFTIAINRTLTNPPFSKYI